jgi:uncharacterized protein (TIGR03437 family)
LAPGSLFSIFGSDLSQSSQGSAVLPLPTSLGGTSVTVNGLAAPLAYVSPTQINGQVPYEIPAGSASIVVTSGASASPVFQARILAAAPGVFQLRPGRAVIQNDDAVTNDVDQPAPAGTVIVIYLTGGGNVDHPIPTGSSARGTVLSRLTLPVAVSIGGVPADVLFAGLTPDFVGLVQVNARVPVDLPPGANEIRINIGGSSSNATLMSVSRPLTSDQLIDRAQSRSLITAETALLYKVFAAFGDRRLPAEYLGHAVEGVHSLIMDEAARKFHSLSAQAQSILEPFFVPPAYPGSWTDQHDKSSDPKRAAAGDLPKDGWLSDGRSAYVKVWWQASNPEHERIAQSIVSAMDKIWQDLRALMGVEPLSDAGKPNDGGDGRLDIYVYDSPNLIAREAAAGVRHWPGECSKSPVYMTVRPAFFSLEVLVHETMHAFQSWYELELPCEEYEWLKDVTAEWAVDYVYPGSNVEHGRAQSYFRDPEHALDEKADRYNHYLFAFYLAEKDRKSAHLIRQIWINTQFYDSLAAVEETLQKARLGGFQLQWPRFAVFNWNRDSWKDYRDWDQLDGGAVSNEPADGGEFRFDDRFYITTVKMNGRPSLEYKMNVKLDHLAARYFRFEFLDEDARSVAFTNPFRLESQPTARVQALVKIENADWKFEDWTEDKVRAFCRDVKSERLEELVLIFTNSEWEDRNHKLKPPEPPRLTVTNVGCWQWKGEVKTTLRLVDGAMNVTETTTVSALFERYDSDAKKRVPPGLLDPPLDPLKKGDEAYWLKSGSGQWSFTGTLSGCTGSNSASFNPEPGSRSYMYVNQYDVKTPFAHVARTLLPSGLPPPWLWTCPVAGTFPGGARRTPTWWWTADPVTPGVTAPKFYVSKDGRTIEGAWQYPLPQVGEILKHEWKFVSQRE